MNIVYNARMGLVRFSKIFPFLLCFVTFVSLTEELFALATSDYVVYDEGITLHTSLSWLIARVYEMNIYTVLVAMYLSVTFETCIWNRLCDVYLLVYICEQNFFPTIELYPEYIAMIIIANMVVGGFFVFKGIKIFTKH